MMKISLFVLLLGLFVETASGQVMQHCVSNVPSTAPGNVFIDHGDGTVTDQRTGLMWSQCTSGTSGADCAAGDATTATWAQALQAAVDSTLAGHTDWRLPNIKELASIVERRCQRPALSIRAFPVAADNYEYWSSSPVANDPPRSWYVAIIGGFGAVGVKAFRRHYLLVRDAN